MPSTQTSSAPAPQRLASLDAFRGLTILTMIFVNSIAGVDSIPAWLKHMPEGRDGMTFVDVVFPAFLFIVGMAIPFALGRRLDRGESCLRILLHVVVRAIALLVVGVFMVNMPGDSEAMGINGNVWSILAFVGVMLVWNQYGPTAARGGGASSPPSRLRIVSWLFRAAGIVLLVALAAVYRGKSDGQTIGMQTSWWGILGLIGWAYLVASLVYIPARRQMGGLVGAVAILLLLYVAEQKGLFAGWPIQNRLSIGTQLGSHAAIVMAGVVIGQLFFDPTAAPRSWGRVLWIVLFGVFLFVAGWLLRPLHGVSKNHATPSWCLYSAAWCCWLYSGLYMIMDLWGGQRWAAIVRPAGEHPLLAYILSHIVYYGLCLWPGNPLWKYAGSGVASLVPHAILALGIVLVSGWLGRRWIRLRL